MLIESAMFYRFDSAHRTEIYPPENTRIRALLPQTERTVQIGCQQSGLCSLIHQCWRTLPQIEWVDHRCMAEFIRPTTLPSGGMHLV